MICTSCSCFGDNDECGCSCHDETVLRCMGEIDGKRCVNIATEIKSDRWYCKTCDPVSKKSEPGPEWDEFFK